MKDYLKDGVPLIALRMGGEGSLVAGLGGFIQRIPAYPVENIVDVTGAGNSYCGGFLVGLAQTGDPRLAGLYGSISAAITLEQFGALVPVQELSEKAQIRLREVK